MPTIVTSEHKPATGAHRIHVRVNGLAQSVPFDSSAIDPHASAIASVLDGTPEGLTETTYARSTGGARFWTAPDPDLDPLGR